MTLFEMGIVALLATYRLTFMLHEENGPADIFTRLRTRLGVRYDQYSNPYGTNWVAKGILCYFCLSVWIATLIAAALVLGAFLRVPDGVLIVLAPFALSGGAIFLKKWAG
jgi:hypothetical protein